MKWIRIEVTNKEKEKLKEYAAFKASKMSIVLTNFIINLKKDKNLVKEFIDKSLINKNELDKTEDKIAFKIEEDLDTFFNKLVKKHNVSKSEFLRVYINSLEPISEDIDINENISTIITTLIDSKTKQSLEQKAKDHNISLNSLIQGLFHNYKYEKLTLKKGIQNDKKVTVNCTKSFKDNFDSISKKENISNSLLLRTFLHYINNLEEIKL